MWLCQGTLACRDSIGMIHNVLKIGDKMWLTTGEGAGVGIRCVLGKSSRGLGLVAGATAGPSKASGAPTGTLFGDGAGAIALLLGRLMDKGGLGAA